jgi:hypothetical protein
MLYTVTVCQLLAAVSLCYAESFDFSSFFFNMFNSLLLMPTPLASTQRHEKNILLIMIIVSWEATPCSLVDIYQLTQHHSPEDSKFNINIINNY